MSTLIKTLLLVLSELSLLIFPASRDEQLIAPLTQKDLLQKLQPRRVDGVVVLARFKDPHVRALLHLVKFHRHPQALQLTASLLEAWLSTLTAKPYVIIPVPLSRNRERERGYNQSELIARAAAAHFSHFQVETSLLCRTRNTKAQSTLNRTERLENMRGAFSVSTPQHPLPETDIILIDDVLTTGATLRAAAQALKGLSPRSITCVAIAH